MAGWKKLGCAVDFSDASRFAMEEAADLACAFGAELVLIHVHDPRRWMGIEWSWVPFALAAVDLERDLAAWRSEAAGRCGMPARSCIRAGDPADELVRAAGDLDLDLLVVGALGQARPGRMAIGPVAERVLRLAPCPVLVAREKEPTALRRAM